MMMMMMVMMMMLMMTQPSYLWKTVQGNARNMSCFFFRFIFKKHQVSSSKKNEDVSPHNADII